MNMWKYGLNYELKIRLSQALFKSRYEGSCGLRLSYLANLAVL